MENDILDDNKEPFLTIWEKIVLGIILSLFVLFLIIFSPLIQYQLLKDRRNGKIK